jgi:hypothetical protein
METLLLTFAVFILAVLAMSLGSLLGNRTIKGSCGGLNNIPGVKCAACTGQCEIKRAAVLGASSQGMREPHDERG